MNNAVFIETDVQRRDWEDLGGHKFPQNFRLCVLQISVLNPPVNGESFDLQQWTRIGAMNRSQDWERRHPWRRAVVPVRKLAGKDAGAPSSGSW